MRICRRSAGSLSVACALALGASSAASAQVTADPPQTAPAGGARDKAAEQGDAAMERLKRVVAGQKSPSPAAVPDPPVGASPELRRRAFDAMHKRAPSPVLEARAREALAAGKAALEAQREVMTKRLGQALGLNAPDLNAIANAAAPKNAKAWVPVLFVSSSMPIATLRAYAIQLERTGGVLAFRGMPGGLTRVTPMARLSAEILRIDPGCSGPACLMRGVQVIIDPILFRQHGITRVPALGLIPGDPTQPYCERDDDNPRSPIIVFGDASLSGLLEEYARLGGKEEVRDAQNRLGAR